MPKADSLEAANLLRAHAQPTSRFLHGSPPLRTFGRLRPDEAPQLLALDYDPDAVPARLTPQRCQTGFAFAAIASTVRSRARLATPDRAYTRGPSGPGLPLPNQWGMGSI
jgi:hypothetical protein